MDTYELVIIGTGPAGIQAATSYLEAGGDRPVLIVSGEHAPPYERPPLSKESLRGDTEPAPSPLEQPDGAEVRLGATVTAIDLDGRTIRLGDSDVSFSRLIVATGSRSTILPNADDEADLHYLRSFDDLARLHQAATHARTALVIGSGFIGCEAAVSLAMRGISVTMVSPEAAPQVSRLGEHAAQAIAEILRGYGVELRAGTEVTQVRAPRTVHLSDGTTLEPDLILAALGAEPATGFLDSTGLQLHEGRVVVDRHMRTETEGVYAAGDAARAEHGLVGRAIPVEHWGDAEAMGKVAGADAAGQETEWREVPGFWTDLGDHSLQYAAWGDGYDRLEVDERPGRFTVWYGDEDGALVGVLTYNADDDFERGRQLIEQGATLDAAVRGDRPVEPE